MIGSTVNVEIKNNIFSRFGNVIAYDTVDTITIDYNLYYSSGGETSRIIWNTTTGSGWECGTIAACQAHGMEAHAPAMGNPKFITLPNGTAGNGNWNIQSSSPTINGHRSVSVWGRQWCNSIYSINYISQWHSDKQSVRHQLRLDLFSKL
jgi:hypothetical protein